MKERISDFTGNIMERVRSPFFFSFGISWTLINWKIPIVLFFYSNEEVVNLHKVNRIEYISSQLQNTCNTVWCPLICAVIYISFRILYRSIDGLTYRWGNSIFEWSSKKGMVSIEAVVRIRKEYELKHKELNKLLKKQEDRESEIGRLGRELATTKRNLDSELKSQDPFFLNGRWDFRLSLISGNQRTGWMQNDYIDIFSDRRIQGSKPGDDGYWNIVSFQYGFSNPHRPILMIIKNTTKQNPEFSIWDLRINSEMNKLEGTIDGCKVILDKS